MARVRRFELLLAGALALTLGVKLVVAGGVQNPSFEAVSEAMRPFFARNGFEIGGSTTFAGRPALLVRKDACLLYSVPVSQQGWHQATVRQSLSAGQGLWYAMRGRLQKDLQPTWSPLAQYYFNKILRYGGLDGQYPPILALVTAGDCDLGQIDWNGLPRVDFVRISMR